MNAEIYHINDMSLPYLKADKPICTEDYKFVYQFILSEKHMCDELYNKLVSDGYVDTSGEIPRNNIEMLNEIFKTLNVAHPEDYNARSLSVGDIVIINNFAYRVEMIGFKIVEVPDNFREVCSRIALEGVNL